MPGTFVSNWRLAGRFAIALVASTLLVTVAAKALASELSAGAAKVDITSAEAGPANDRLYVKALVISDGKATLAIVTVDAVAIGEIGTIGNDYLPKVRAALEKEVHIPAGNVLVNASHCHGVVCADVAERTVQAVKQAAANRTPVDRRAHV